MSVLITTGLLIALALWLAGRYQRLVRLRTQVLRAWQQVDAQLKRRHDLIVPLLQRLETAAGIERATLDEVTAARNRAAAAKGPADAGGKEAALTAAIDVAIQIARRQPQLVADPQLAGGQQELAAAVDAIIRARQAYNDVADRYNTAADASPNNLIAGVAGFKPAELFDMPASDLGR